MVTFTHKGDLSRTDRFFERIKESVKLSSFDKYGRMGVEALSMATPKDTGKTAESWTYKIEHNHGDISIIWSNTNVNKGVNIAVILQYGHGTGTGGYVKGIDYINPAMKPVFDEIANSAWEEVSKA